MKTSCSDTLLDENSIFVFSILCTDVLFLIQISLVVNVASDCGYTDNHYSKLKQLHNHYSATGKFTVLAFPCNQFGRQEPGVSNLKSL